MGAFSDRTCAKIGASFKHRPYMVLIVDGFDVLNVVHTLVIAGAIRVQAWPSGHGESYWHFTRPEPKHRAARPRPIVKAVPR